MLKLILAILISFVVTAQAAVDLPGDSDSVVMTTALEPTTALSGYAVVKSDTISAASHSIIANFDWNSGSPYGWSFFINQDEIFFAASDGTAFESANWLNKISVGVKTRVGFTYNAGTVTFYQDGSSGSSDSSTEAAITYNANSSGWIGRTFTGDGWDGIIYEVAIWNVVLTAAEMNSMINSYVKRIPLQIRPNNLLGYWALDDNVGTGIDGDVYIDMSSNGNTGTGDDPDENSINTPEEVLSYP